jgi:hypothetical protein
MKVSLRFLPVLLVIESTALAVAQSAPPWSKGANDPAARKGYVFRVSDVHNVPDLHGNPSDAKLVIFIGGNQFFVLPQLITAFEHHHPELKGHIFYETLPPRFAPSRSLWIAGRFLHRQSLRPYHISSRV